MFPLIEMWQSGDHTQQYCCEEQDISLSVFRYWLAKYCKLFDSDNEPDYTAVGFISLHPDKLSGVHETALEYSCRMGKYYASIS